MRRTSQFSVLVAAMAALSLLLSGIATGDTVATNVVGGGGGTVTTQAGVGADVDFWIEVGAQGGMPGCDAADGSAATLSYGSLPAGVSVDPTSLVFSSCGSTNAQSFTFTATAPGSYSIPNVGVSDSTGNYNTNGTRFTLSVTKAATSLAVEPAGGEYGGTADLSATLTSNDAGVSGKSIAFTLNGSSVGSATTGSDGVATLTGVSLAGINADTYPSGVGASFTADTTHEESSGSNSLTVDQASQTIDVTTPAPASAAYDESFDVAAEGGDSGNPVTFSSSGVCSNTGATFTMTSGSGTCFVKYNQAGNTNYEAAVEVTEEVAATKAAQDPVTVTGPDSGTYGDFLTMQASGGTVSGAYVFAVTGDSDACAIVDDATSLNDGQLEITKGSGTCEITATKPGNGDYEDETSEAHVVTVNRAAQTDDVTVTAPTEGVYGDLVEMAATGGSGTGGYTFEVTSASQSCAIVTSGPDTGKLQITSGTGFCEITATRDADDNHDESSPSAAHRFDVTAKELTVSGLSAEDKLYDGGVEAVVSGTPALNGIVGTDDVSLSGTATGEFADADVADDKSVTVSGLTLAGTDMGNYALTLPILEADITARNLTVSGLSAQNKVYDGGVDADLTGTPVLNNVVDGDDVTLTGTAAGAFGDADVADDKDVTVTGLSLSGTGVSNYTLTLPLLSADITARPVTVTADAKVKVAGDDDPDLTYQVAGGIGETLAGELDRDAGEDPGTYPITQGSVTDANNTNYEITYVGANLTITPACVTTATFGAPIKDGVRNIAKLGSVIPVKVTLTDCNGEPINGKDLSLKLLAGNSDPDTATASDFLEATSVSKADTGGVMRLLDDGQYMYNLSTKGLTAQTPYTIVVRDTSWADPWMSAPRVASAVIEAKK